MANSTQAFGIVVFLVAFALLVGAWAAGGNIVLLLQGAGLVMLAFSLSLFRKAKSSDKTEE